MKDPQCKSPHAAFYEKLYQETDSLIASKKFSYGRRIIHFYLLLLKLEKWEISPNRLVDQRAFPIYFWIIWQKNGSAFAGAAYYSSEAGHGNSKRIQG